MGSSLRRDERGITAVVGAVSLVAIFAAVTLTADAGNVWQTRRNMVTATDAAALSEAAQLAKQGLAGVTPASCSGTYDSILTKNAGTDVYERICSLVTFAAPGTGYVSVEARKPIDVRFGAVLGLGDTNAYSLSAAMVGFPSGARGLRPIGFCNQNDHLKEWRALKSGSLTQAAFDALKGAGDTDGDLRIDHPVGGPQQSYLGYGVVHRMYFNKGNDDGACGSFPGNWGWLNFDGGEGGSGTSEIEDWLEDGYQGEVSIRLDSQSACEGDPGQGDASNSEEGCVPATPGSLSSSVKQELESIRDKPIYVMVFDAGGCTGGGSTCRFESWAFLGVKIRGWYLSGAEEDRYFDFEFINLQISGTCCDSQPGTEDLGVRAIKLCAVDHDPIAIASADRCGAVSN